MQTTLEQVTLDVLTLKKFSDLDAWRLISQAGEVVAAQQPARTAARVPRGQHGVREREGHRSIPLLLGVIHTLPRIHNCAKRPG